MSVCLRKIARRTGILLASVALMSIFLLSGFAATDTSPGRLDQRLIGKESHTAVDLIIQTHNRPGQALEQLLEAQGCTLRSTFHLINGVAATCPGRAITPLLQHAEITYVESDELVSFPLDNSRGQIKANLASTNFNVDGSGVRIVLIDSGINYSHSGLSGANFTLEHAFFGGPSVDDGFPSSHGTRSACIIACSHSTYKGIAPKAEILNAKVGNEGALPSAVVTALEWAVNNSADVVLVNVAGAIPGSCAGDDAMSVAVNLAHNKTSVVVPAGNTGQDGNQTINTPGCAEHAITVGSVGDTNNISVFSSKGPTSDGRVKPDVMAPGEDIISAEKPSPSFAGASGTSFSGPHVTGMIALMKQARKKLFSDEIKTIVKSTALDLGLPTMWQGEGLVNAEAAVNLSTQWLDITNISTRNVFVPNPAPKGMNFSFNLSINNTGNTEANGTIAQIVGWTPNGLQLVNSDPVHSLGQLKGRESVKTTWVMKSGPAKTYNVTLNVTATGLASDIFSVLVVVE